MKQGRLNGGEKQLYNFDASSMERKKVSMKRVQEAQSKAQESLASAVFKRKKAQKLMDNADLAIYLAAMAVKIAEKIQIYESSSGSCS
ncbi:hypothetical protein AQUCO_02700423v1 [Aquilegia coerulea]|uniref:Uncharacterized protein n=1 Tax=Aquilegia coerulea TaxID=218851 RepID=A0A2G5D6U3_AQUCA|nr:hypothetical protein AQUCO_02700423v1 [Aquilegia coerulea]